MTSTKKLLTIAMALMFVLNSCSIEKRKYLSGYNVDWNHSSKIAFEHQTIHTEKSEAILPSEVKFQDCNLIAEKNQDAGNLVASSDEKQIIVLKSENTNFFEKEPQPPARKKIIPLKQKTEVNMGAQPAKAEKLIRQTKMSDGTEKKKSPVWIWIIVGLALVIGAVSLLSTLKEK